MSAKQSQADFFGSVPGFPISLAVRAGDYAYTATLGAHTFDAEKVVYDSDGRVLSDGSGRGAAGIEEQTRATMRNVEAALRGVDCALEDVIDMTVWLRDPRDFKAFNLIYAEFFVANKPTRTVLRADFMFDCRIEMKAIAYKPRVTDRSA
jgi:enamine deaminase RidA (YjgF/YER057c/UK114 family)